MSQTRIFCHACKHGVATKRPGSVKPLPKGSIGLVVFGLALVECVDCKQTQWVRVPKPTKKR